MNRSKLSPFKMLLMLYKNSLGTNYENSFYNKSKECGLKKLKAFGESIVVFLEQRGYYFTSSIIDDVLNIYYQDSLCTSYNLDFINRIKNERQLELQLFTEWGLLLDLKEKELGLITL